MASAAIWPLIAEENEARREASKFDKARASEAARARHAVRTKRCEPLSRDHKAENARSTVGLVVDTKRFARKRASLLGLVVDTKRFGRKRPNRFRPSWGILGL